MATLIAEGEPYNFYDSTEGIAFGPTFEQREHAEHFRRWLLDINRMPYGDWLDARPDFWKQRYSAWFTENVDGETGELVDAPWFDYKPHHRVEVTLLTGDKVKGEILRRDGQQDGWRVKLDERPNRHFSEFVTVPGDRLRLVSRASIA